MLGGSISGTRVPDLSEKNGILVIYRAGGDA